MIAMPPNEQIEVDAHGEQDEREGAGALCWMLLSLFVAGIAVLLVVVGSRR